MTGIHQLRQFLFGTEGRIHLKIIRSGIFVVKISPKNRCKVQTLHIQILQVIQPGTDSPQIPSHIMIPIRCAPPIHAALRIIFPVSVAEPLRKYLIINLAFAPFRNGETVLFIGIKKFIKTVRINPAQDGPPRGPLRNLFLNPPGSQIQLFASLPHQFEIVFLVSCHFGKRHLHRIIVRLLIAEAAGHTEFPYPFRRCPGVNSQAAFRRILSCRPQPEA